MSRDADPQQRLWLSLGHGGKTAPQTTWRYWAKPDAKREWVIAAPNGLAEFELKHHDLYLNGEKLLTAETQWSATWRALAYFYEHLIPKIEPPPISR